MKHNALVLNETVPLAPMAAARTLDELRADVVSTARKWAIEEVSAVIAHQMNEPLTALKLYLHEMKRQSAQVGNEATPDATQTLADRALHETQRICDFVEDLAQQSAAPADAPMALPHGRDAIFSWATNSKLRTPLSSPLNSIQHLTPREHEVLSVIAGGASNKEGGRHLGISTRTFEVHRANIMEKLGARNAADLVRIALS